MNNMTFKDNSNYKYFSMIPHIITEIGLKGNEIAVYVAIKRSAGENSICTKSKAKLAKQAGVCPKTIFTIIQKLCLINKIIGKPLIVCTARLTEDGDNDTNLIEIVDIWPESTNLFNKIISGEVNFTLPQVTITGGVGYPLPEGQVKFTHKEEHIKKNPVKNNNTTFPKVAPVVVFSSIENLEDPSITKKDKIDLCQKYTQSIIDNAVAVVSDSKFVPLVSLLVALRAACKHKWKPNMKTLPEIARNRKLAQELEGTHNNYTYVVCNKYLEIIKGPKSECVKYENTFKNFCEQVEKVGNITIPTKLKI